MTRITRLFLYALIEAKSKISSIPNRLRRDPLSLLNRTTFAIASLGCCTSYVLNLETVPYTNRRRFMYIPSRLERMYGDRMFEERKSGRYEGKMLPSSHPDNVRVQKIAKDIIEATRRELRKDRHRRAQTAHVEEFNWEVIVVDDPCDGASCCLGGKIVVHTGLLCASKSDDEIAAVIGHEVGHVVARHLLEKLFGTTKPISNSSPIFISPFLFLNLSRSRRNEREADIIGLFLSASAGYDPQAAIRRLERCNVEKIKVSNFLDYMNSTHPPAEERVQLLSNPKIMEEALSMYREALSRRI